MTRLLSVADPSAQHTGHLVNGAFFLPQPLQAARSQLRGLQDLPGLLDAAGHDPTRTPATAPIVMVGAHIDTVLGAPGADDDGSGNGVAQEIARVISQYPLDKEIRFGGWAGEEDGYIGSQAYLASLPAAEKARFVGEWQMDMVGSPFPDARLWALTPDGKSNLVTDSLHSSAGRSAITGFNNCKLSRSDHQAFFDVGIPSAAISWINYLTPTTGCTGTREGNIAAEPEYHKPTDTMANIDQGRMQVMLSLVGGAVMHAALNQVDITSVPNAAVTGDCGDGVRILGATDADGKAAVFVPHATCTFAVGNASAVGAGLRRPPDRARGDLRGRLGAGDAVADAGSVGLLRRVGAGHHARPTRRRRRPT